MAGKRTNTAAAEPDHIALLAKLREGDEAAIAKAYNKVFSSPLGRLVLMHLASLNGVGGIRGPGLSGEDRHYQDGRHDAALEIIEKAGLDKAAVVLMVMTDNLEGQEHDGPEPEFG